MPGFASKPSPARLAVTAGIVLLTTLAAGAAEKRYGPGVSDSEIKLGQTMPYSGPASGYASVGLTEAACIKMLNEQDGINGRKIALISLDDGYSPPKTVEQTRRLVEDEKVLAIFGSLGTAANSSIQKYLNQRKVPQVFISTGATKWGDPEHFPWTMGWAPNYQLEARIYAQYVLQHIDNARIAVLYQNDDYGKTTSRASATGDHPQIRGAIHPQGLRHRLAPRSVHQQRRLLDRCGDETRWPRAGARSLLRPLPEGRHRSALARRQGHAGLPCRHEEIPAQYRYRR
jgi:hypothetical protein